MKAANMISSLIAVGIAGFFFFMTYQFEEVAVQDTGPAFLPRIYAGCLATLSLLLMIRSLKSEEQTESRSNFKLAFMTMLLVTILIALIPILGFFVITPVAVFVFLKLFSEKNIYTLIGLPIGIVLFVFLVFEKALSVPIPTGLIFR